MYFKHERSNLSCSNRWLGIRFIVEIMTHDIDEKNRFHHVRESEKATLDVSTKRIASDYTIEIENWLE